MSTKGEFEREERHLSAASGTSDQYVHDSMKLCGKGNYNFFIIADGLCVEDACALEAVLIAACGAHLHKVAGFKNAYNIRRGRKRVGKYLVVQEMLTMLNSVKELGMETRYAARRVLTAREIELNLSELI
ncbi:hypothetical protein Ndes2526B_g02019 [Nannochloris sp. 'desiccata']|nr:hypothetical protein NADE_002763 [Chlorella desiccata (nom. nud.)]